MSISAATSQNLKSLNRSFNRVQSHAPCWGRSLKRRDHRPSCELDRALEAPLSTRVLGTWVVFAFSALGGWSESTALRIVMCCWEHQLGLRVAPSKAFLQTFKIWRADVGIWLSCCRPRQASFVSFLCLLKLPPTTLEWPASLLWALPALPSPRCLWKILPGSSGEFWINTPPEGLNPALLSQDCILEKSSHCGSSEQGYIPRTGRGRGAPDCPGRGRGSAGGHGLSMTSSNMYHSSTRCSCFLHLPNKMLDLLSSSGHGPWEEFSHQAELVSVIPPTILLSTVIVLFEISKENVIWTFRLF